MKNKVNIFALFGPDGSGKSTVADICQEILEKSNINVVRLHWRPRVLPSLKKNYETLSFNNPDNLKTRNYLISFVCYLYFFIDFLFFQYSYKRIYKNKETIILYERFFYDILIHPKRYKLKKIKWLAFLLSKFLKRPGLVFVLKGTPEIIQNRKPELGKYEIERQINTMLKTFPKLLPITSINVDKNSAYQISKIALKNMKENFNLNIKI